MDCALLLLQDLSLKLFVSLSLVFLLQPFICFTLLLSFTINAPSLCLQLLAVFHLRVLIL